MKHFTKQQKEEIYNQLEKFIDNICSINDLKTVSTNLKFCTISTLYNYLQKYRKEKGINKSIKYDNLAVDYFKKIDSDKKAYLLGLFVTDGHLSSKRNLFSFSSIDKELVEFFISELYNGDNRILKSYPMTIFGTNIPSGKTGYRIRIERALFCENLRLLNITHGKDKLSKFILDVIPDEFKKDFIRGLFDGDGCISYTQAFKRNKPCGRKKPTLYICNQDINFLKKIQKELILNNVYMKIYSDNKIHYLKCSSLSTVDKFYKYIYYNSTFCLMRKKEKFLYVNTEVIE